MALKVNVDDWLGRFTAGFRPAGEGDFEAALRNLLSLAPEHRDRIRRAHARIPFGQVFVVLDGDQNTGEVLMFEVTEGPFYSPNHVHNQSPFADFGEKIWTFDGVLWDIQSGGGPVFHRPGDEAICHGPETRHEPYIPVWWIGLIYQPAGSRLL